MSLRLRKLTVISSTKIYTQNLLHSFTFEKPMVMKRFLVGETVDMTNVNAEVE